MRSPRALLPLVLAAGLLPAQDLVLTGATLLDGDGSVLPGATLVIQGGRVAQAGAGLALPAGVPVVDASGLFLTPALVDAGSSLGLAEVQLNEEETEVNPDLSLKDGLDLAHPGFRRALENGVATICLLPGTRNVIAGRALVVRFTGPEGRPEVALPATALVATMGNDPGAGNQRFPGSPYFRRPTTRMGTVWVFRQAFGEAARTAGPGGETLRQALAGSIQLRVTARAYFDITTALDLAREFGLKVAAIDEAHEAWRAVAALKEAGVPVAAAPSSLPFRRDDVELEPNFLARIAAAGIPLAIQTGRGLTDLSLVAEARLARRLGLPAAEALKAVTAVPAGIVGLADRIGTLKAGMDADLVLWENDPLGPLGRVRCVLVRGRVASGALPGRPGGSL